MADIFVSYARADMAREAGDRGILATLHFETADLPPHVE